MVNFKEQGKEKIMFEGWSLSHLFICAMQLLLFKNFTRILATGAIKSPR